MDKDLLTVSWGGGVNSTAMLIGMIQKSIIPDLILFADTGGEKPETYEYKEEFNKYLVKNNFPEIITVSAAKKYKSLEDQCLNLGVLPSVAYGWRTCSDRWKVNPQDKYINNWAPARESWKSGKRVLKAIGFDAGEDRRINKYYDDKKYHYIFPLKEWGWFREDCLNVIQKTGLSNPPKSSCFFCPHSTKKEIIWLYNNHPDLIDRSLKLEDNSKDNNTTVKGLGRRWSWTDLIRQYKDNLIDENGKPNKDCKISLPVMADPDEAPCGCYDGEE